MGRYGKLYYTVDEYAMADAKALQGRNFRRLPYRCLIPAILKIRRPTGRSGRRPRGNPSRPYICARNWHVLTSDSSSLYPRLSRFRPPKNTKGKNPTRVEIFAATPRMANDPDKRYAQYPISCEHRRAQSPIRGLRWRRFLHPANGIAAPRPRFARCSRGAEHPPR